MANETRNVKESIEDRINTQLSAQTLDWEGLDFDSDGVTNWIAPDILGYSPTVTRLSERHEDWTVSFNCFTRTGPTGLTTHKIYELVDAVLAAFDQVTMAVKDWADPGQPTIHYLRFSEGTVTPIATPAEAGKFTQQRNVTFSAMLIG